MKHKILSVLVCLLVAVGYVRADENETYTRPMIGLRGAFDINIPGDYHTPAGSFKMYNQGYGGTLGAVCNIYLGRNFYFEPGVSLYYDHYGCDYEVISASGEISDSEPAVYKMGFRIPFVFGYNFNITDRFAITVFTGPELSYSFAGKILLKDPDEWGDMSTSPFDTDRRTEVAWKIGAGLPFDNILVSVDAAIGMTDLLKSSDMSFRQHRVSIGLTYYF